MGMPEIPTILIMAICVIMPTWLIIFLRKKYTGKVCLALLLGFFFPAIGQLFVAEKAGWFIVGLGLCFMLFRPTLGAQTAWR